MEYIKKYWKDKFRPALTSFSCEAVGGDREMAKDVATMFTLASAGFGIHDDILDKSLHKGLRRTVFGLYGIDGALLAGDLLIVKAWAIVENMIRKTQKPTKIADIIRTYGNLSVEICEAELMETQSRRKLDLGIENYEKLLWKAMAEMEACARIGGIMGDGQPCEVDSLGEYGRRLGLISRLGDDVEDCLNLNGSLLPRIENESLPLPLLYAASSSKERYAEIRDIINKTKTTPSDAQALLKFCFEAESFEYVCKVARKKEKEAIQKLRILKPSIARDMLSLMARRSYARVASMCI